MTCVTDAMLPYILMCMTESSITIESVLLFDQNGFTVNQMGQWEKSGTVVDEAPQIIGEPTTPFG